MEKENLQTLLPSQVSLVSIVGATWRQHSHLPPVASEWPVGSCRGREEIIEGAGGRFATPRETGSPLAVTENTHLDQQTRNEVGVIGEEKMGGTRLMIKTAMVTAEAGGTMHKDYSATEGRSPQTMPASC